MLDRYKSLAAWQRADDLYLRVHQLTQKYFPRDEQFGLTAQLRRAAYSVAANIVEGFSRLHTRERRQFLHVAWGSLQEVAYCLHAAHRMGFIDDVTYADLEADVKRTAAPLSGLMRLERRVATDRQEDER